MFLTRRPPRHRRRCNGRQATLGLPCPAVAGLYLPSVPGTAPGGKTGELMAHRMDRSRLLACVALLTLLLAGLVGLLRPASTEAAATLVGPKAYYLALGDSLAFGYQPNWDWSNGYADDWYATLRSRGTTSYTNYGCPGETSSTFINGGCPYSYLRHTKYSGAQLPAAVSFIKAHPGQVSPVSLDIGANDLLGDINESTCAVSSTWNADLQRLDSNLTQTILPQLVAALTAGNTRTGDLVMMNYYNPYQNTCPNSPTYIAQLNAHLAVDAAQFNVPLADVFTAFGGSNAPICNYTWMCSSYNDIHATGGRSGEPGNGYAVIANAFQSATYAAPPTTGAITGQVTDSSTSNPTLGIPGATVSAGGASTTTGSNGSYILSGVPAGSVTVSASAAGYGSGSRSSVLVTAGQTTSGINLSLTPTAGTLRGTVTDSVTTNPVSGASVSIGGVTTFTDGSGGYTLSGVPLGSQPAHISASYYATWNANVTVNPGSQTANFSLTPTTGTVTGTVLDAVTSSGVAGATVSVGGVSTTTVASGAYALTHVPYSSGASQTVNASASGYASNSTTVIVQPGLSVAASTISLTPTTGSVSGKVTVAGTATGIGGATVSSGGVSTQTRADGTYTLAGVTPGSGLTVTASASGYGSASQTNVTVLAGQTTGNVNFQLTPTAGSIVGTVTLRGRLVSGATVTLSGNGLSRTTTTDGSGHYQFLNVPAGTYTARASVYGGWIQQSKSVTVSGGTTTLNFAM